MTWTFTRFGLINALLSLIPIFPILTLLPGIFSAMSLEKVVNSCETSYKIIMYSSLTLASLLILIYILRIDKILVKSKRGQRLNFRVASLVLYLLTNTFALILIVGPYLACHGDGQTILACIYSGPIASICLIAFGFILDLKATGANTGQ